MYSDTEKKQIAETIIQQMGGNKFKVMTGAKNFKYGISVWDNVYVEFSIPNRKVNRVNIELMPSDDYNMTFYKGEIVVKRVDGIFFDMLQTAFTNVTGLYTHL